MTGGDFFNGLLERSYLDGTVPFVIAGQPGPALAGPVVNSTRQSIFSEDGCADQVRA
jgi:hypothetical protein